MSNQQKILNYLSSGEWKCFANADFYMKDDRTRIAELRKKGYVFESKPCDGRCGVKHDSGVFMRRLVATPADYEKPFIVPLSSGVKFAKGESEALKWIREEYKNRPVKQLSQVGGLW